MNTPSHVLINLALHRAGGKRASFIPWKAILLGSFLPDVPLAILSIAASFYYRVLLGNNSPELMETVFHPLYFTNPIWISAHNMLHSPLALGIYLAVMWRWRAQAGKVQHWLFWFFVSCSVHTSIDILTHFDDGPVLFWPLNWQFRFHSPVSYWDPAHFGGQFIIFELVLDVALLGYLLIPKLIAHFSRPKTTAN
jgi:hypothetical protein